MLLPEYVTKFVRVDPTREAIFLEEFNETVIVKFAKWYTAYDVIILGKIFGQKKLRAKLFFEKYGATAKQVAHWINGAQQSLWIHGELTTKLAMRQTGLSAPWVMMVHTALPHLEQAQKDGLDNLTPIIALFDKSPHDIKKAVGKSTWTKLSHNSFTRNKKLALWAHGRHYPEYITELVDVPSTLIGTSTPVLIKVAMRNLPTYKEAATWLKTRLWHPTPEIPVPSRLVEDTIILSTQLGEITNLNWSLRRWHEAHEQFTAALNEQRYSRDAICTPHEFVDEEHGLKAVRLISAREIADEGVAMHHCVVGYIGVVREGSYYVYSIRDADNQRVGTLGVRQLYEYDAGTGLPHTYVGRFISDQLVGPCNKRFEQSFHIDNLLWYINNVERNLDDDRVLSGDTPF